MFSVANHVISASSITIFAASVTAGQRKGPTNLSLPAGKAATGTHRLLRVESMMPVLR
jgi:hypothetical protein